MLRLLCPSGAFAARLTAASAACQKRKCPPESNDIRRAFDFMELLCEQRLDRLGQLFITNILEADHTLFVDDINGWEVLNAPVIHEAALVAIPPMRPRHRLSLQEAGQRIELFISGNANQLKWLILELLDHLTLMRNHRLAGSTPRSPDI